MQNKALMLAVEYLYLQSRRCVFKTKISSCVLLCTTLMHQSWVAIRVQQFIAQIPNYCNHVLYRRVLLHVKRNTVKLLKLTS